MHNHYFASQVSAAMPTNAASETLTKGLFPHSAGTLVNIFFVHIVFPYSVFQ